MADIQIILEVLGAKDMEKAARSTVTLTNKIDSLGKQLKKGIIDNRQFQVGVQQLIKKNAELGGGYQRLQRDVQKYAFSLQRSINDQVRAEAAIENTTQAIQTQTAAVNSAAAAQNRMSVATQGSTRRIGQSSTLIQQSGYQLGDLIVQIQSGTNWMVAFGQQATQVAGTLTLLGGKMVLIGTALGIAIPLLTAVGAAFMRTRDSARGLSEELGNLRDIESDLKDFGESFGESLIGKIEEVREQFGNLVADAYKAQVAIVQSTLAASTEAGLFGIGRSLASDLINKDLLEGNRRDQQEELQRLINEEVQPLLNQMLDPTIKSTEELAQVFEEVYSELSQFDYVTERGLERFRAIAAEAGIISQLRQQTNQQTEQEAESLERIYDAIASNAEIAIRTAEEQKERQESLIQAARGYYQSRVAGEIMAARESEQAAGRSIDAQRQYQQSRIAGEKTLHELVQYYADQAIKAIEDSRVEAERVQGVLDAIANSDMPITGKINSLASALGIAADAAARLLGFLPETASSAPGAGFGPSDPGLVNQTGTTNPLAYTGYTVTPPSEPSSKGGGGVPEFVSKIISSDLQKAIEEAAELTRQYEQEVKLLDTALENGLISQQEYNAYLVDAQEAYNQAADAASNYEEVLLTMANTASSAIGDAMMSIVDGTKSAKDAFSDMAQVILKKAFELLVINPILNSIFGGIPGFNMLPAIGQVEAKGGVWSGGSKVTAFATGGVVGSPTFFPMANGDVGLMGEAGPEAIMPLKRGKGGRLGVEVSGEQGNVVINQTFAFQANGDESVKRIIASEAPKIAALTQKQMLDARRRGGVVRDTFA